MLQKSYSYPVNNVSKIHPYLGLGVLVSGSDIFFSTSIVKPTERQCEI